MHEAVTCLMLPPSTGHFTPLHHYIMTYRIHLFIHKSRLGLSWTDVWDWAHIHVNILDLDHNMKTTSGYSLEINKSQNEGTAKAEESFRLQCLWGCFCFGMHNRKNSCGWENKCNKYCFKQYLLLLEITKRSAPLTQTLFSTVLLCGPSWFTVKGH